MLEDDFHSGRLSWPQIPQPFILQDVAEGYHVENLSDGDMEFGILADAILGVQDISLEGFQTKLPTLTGIREDYLKGITAERLVVLDAAKMLQHDGIVVHEEVA